MNPVLYRVLRFVVLFALAAGLSALVTFVSFDEPAPPSTPPVHIGGTFSLTDHTGKHVTDQDYADAHKLVFFGFTYCPDVCPMTLQNIAAALESLGSAQCDMLKTLFITVDPIRDTPEALAAYVAQFHPDIIGLTGTPAQIDQAVKTWRVYATKQENPDSSEYSMNHSGTIYIMSPENTLLDMLSSTATPEEITEKIDRLLPAC